MRAAVTLLLTVLTTTGVWAQSPTTVSTEKQLTDAIADGATNIQLDADIQLSNYLSINGITVTIDLNGHRLYRELDSSSPDGHIFWVHANDNVGGNLTIDDSSNDNSGTIEGGYAPNGGGINVWPGCSLTVSGVTFQNNSARDCGGAIFVREGATVTISNATFKGNSAGDHGGAVWNNGTLTATNCKFENNTAKDVGGIYNAVSDDGTTAGTATLTGCTFTSNTSSAGAGALANAVGNTEMTIDGCTITGNTAGSRGGGIWNGGTLNMKGKVTVTGNTKDGGETSNVFLKIGKVITVTGSLTGSSIGVDLESVTGTFTSGFKTYHDGVAPSTIYTDDHSDIGNMELDDDGEACLTPSGITPVSYIERSWDDTNKEVISKQKNLKGIMIGYDSSPIKGQYKEVTNASADKPDEWFGMGGYSDDVAEFYVVRGEVNRETIVVQGKNVHLILCDGATLTLTGGLKLEGDNKLYIHCQSYGGAMGRLMVTNKYKGAAGIGSALDNGTEKTVGELVIHGGHIEANGGKFGAGIGSCEMSSPGNIDLCNKVTVYGGYVIATGGEAAAGIGSGSYSSDDYYGYGRLCGGTFTIYDGTVTANGGIFAAGIGGGKNCCGVVVKIHGGSVTATGGMSGAGIGSGIGGLCSRGCKVTITGGTVTATGGEHATGIGGGESGNGGDVTITGGTVIAKAGTQGDINRAIGPGFTSTSDGTLTIGDEMMVGAGNNGSVERICDAGYRKNACRYHSYAEISPCTHPSGHTYTINDDGTHTSHCKHCAVKETAAHSTGTCVCGYEDFFTITIATSSNGSYYEGVDEVVKVGNNKPYTLPMCSIIPEGYDFAGWVVNPESQDNGIRPNEGETLLPAGENITITADVTIFARYRVLEISLADNADNYETIFNYDGEVAPTVTLTGRTLYRDGNWNTLCLPFAVTDGDEADGVTFSGTPLEGATVLTLEKASFDKNTLTLNFEETTAMEPGKPYLVRWANDSEQPTIVNPVFHGVTISNTSPGNEAVVAGIVSFTGLYAPLKISEEGDETVLYLGADNTFRYPDGATDINAFRAFFYTSTRLGDVNVDGTINVTDVTLMVDYILGMEDDSFVFENADITRDGIISVTDVTALVDLILGGNSILKVVVNGADGLTFCGGGSGPARVSRQ